MSSKTRARETSEVEHFNQKQPSISNQSMSQKQYRFGCDLPQQDEMALLVREFRYQMLLQEQRFKRFKKTTQETIPTLFEIEELVEILQNRLPDKNVYKVIKQLYLNLIPQNLLRSKRKVPNSRITTQEQVREVLYQNSPFFKIQNNIGLIENLKQFGGFKKVYLCSLWKAQEIYDEPTKYRYKLRRLVAKSFSERDHSVQQFRVEIAANNENIVVDGQRYKSALETVVIQAYRFLEQFVINQCQIPINRLARQEIRMMCARLFHCRQTLRDQQCNIFLDIIRIKYGLADVTLDEYFTLKFYCTTQKGLRVILLKRMNESGRSRQSTKINIDENENFDDTKSIIYQKTVKNNHSLQLQNIWSIKMEKQFIQVYKNTQHFVHIKAYFKEKYPQYEEFFRGTGLKNRLFQILRASMRKVRDINEKTKKKRPQLIHLNDDRIKYIMKSTRALKARLMLVDIYLDDNKTYNNRIQEMVVELNAAIADRGSTSRSVCSYSSFSNSEHYSLSDVQNSKLQEKKEKRKKLAKQRKEQNINPAKLMKNPLYREYFQQQLKYDDEFDNNGEGDYETSQIFESGQYQYDFYDQRNGYLDRYMQDQESEYLAQYRV